MADPERKNDKLVEFRIAANGRGKDDTTFVFVKCWNKTGEFVEKYFKKGNPVLVEGRLEIRRHEEKTYTACVAENVEFCNGKPNVDTNTTESTDDSPAF